MHSQLIHIISSQGTFRWLHCQVGGHFVELLFLRVVQHFPGITSEETSYGVSAADYVVMARGPTKTGQSTSPKWQNSQRNSKPRQKPGIWSVSWHKDGKKNVVYAMLLLNSCCQACGLTNNGHSCASSTSFWTANMCSNLGSPEWTCWIQVLQ